MPYTKEQLEQWINGWNISADKKQAALASLGDPDIASQIGAGVLMRSDYSKRQDELATKQTELDRNASETMQLRSQLETWKQTNEPLYQQALTKLGSLQKQAGALARAYTEGGGDLTTLSLEDDFEPPEPKKADTAPPVDLSGYVKADAAAAQAVGLTKVNARLYKLGQQHKQLFGNDDAFDPEALVDYAMQKKVSLDEAWAEQHKVAERRAALQEEQIQSRIAAAVKDKETELLTRQALPHARAGEFGDESIMNTIFKQDDSEQGQQARMHDQAVSKAVGSVAELMQRDGGRITGI